MTQDLIADYESAGFRGQLGHGDRRALIVVDFVRAYLDEASPLYAGGRGKKAFESCVRLVEAARDSAIPVVFTAVVYEPGVAEDGGLFRRKVPALDSFERGNPLASFDERLAPAAGERLIEKKYPSAFFGTPLASDLVVLGVDTLLISGVSTSGCVRATAVDAMQHGYVPLVVRDACGDRDERPHDANLFDLESKYAEVITEQEAMSLLRSDAAQEPR